MKELFLAWHSDNTNSVIIYRVLKIIIQKICKYSFLPRNVIIVIVCISCSNSPAPQGVKGARSRELKPLEASCILLVKA